MTAEVKSRNEECAEKLFKYIPWGSSTCSKKAVLTPEEPAVIVKGKGCRVWDADGKEYIDFRNALGPVTIGYNIPEINESIKNQLDDGIIFGYAHPIEGEVAELICNMVPCAEKARFLKTGGEAVAACIKLARAYTGKSHIIQIGYNGWLNSVAMGANILPGSEAESCPEGIPDELSALHHCCSWNDKEGVEKLFKELNGKIAALLISADYAKMELGRDFYPMMKL
ncbi:MAG: aminotransferase class III-fold pyridoxal phosphate-dependent enzyme [Planctomycetota bacterium]